MPSHHNTRSQKNKGSKPATKKQKTPLTAAAEDSLKKVQARTIQKTIRKDLEITTEKNIEIPEQQQDDDMDEDPPEVPLTSPKEIIASSSTQTSQDTTAPLKIVNTIVTPINTTYEESAQLEKNFEPNHLPVPPEQVYEKITRRTSFRAATLLENVKGKNKSDKLKEVCHLFGHKDEYAGKMLQTISKIPYMVIFFDSMETLTTAIQDPIKLDDQHTYKFIPYEEIKPPTTTEMLDKEKQRTIQVLDIPLNVKAHLVRSVFSKYGTITRCNMTTKGIFQQAYILYESIDTLHTFMDIWAEFLERDSVRIIPLKATEEERNLRKQYFLKLAGFKSGTKARDLYHVIKDTQAKSFYIPRHPGTYRMANYGFMAFNSEQDVIAASKKFYEYEGTKLFWGTASMKTCFACGSPEHMIKACNRIHERKNNKNNIDPRIQKLYNKYRPAQHHSAPRSYADAARRRPNRNNTQRGTAASGSMHDPNMHKNLGELRNILNALSSQVKEVLTEFKNLKTSTSENAVKTPQNTPNKSSNTLSNNKGKQTNVQNKSAQNKRHWNEANLSSSS